MQAEDRHGRKQCVAQHVAQEHQRLGEPLGARGAHVVRAQSLDDLTTQIADEDRRKLERQRERWEEQIPDVLGRGFPKAGYREPVEGEPEQKNEQDAEPEVGCRQREEETYADEMVGPPALVDRGQNPEREGDDGSEAHGIAGECQRYGYPGQHEITDLLAIQQRLAHVAVSEPRYEHPVLLEERSVQPELLAKLRGLLVRRAVTEDQERRISRQDPDHAEYDDGHAEEHERHEDETSADVGGAAHISRSLDQPDG